MRQYPPTLVLNADFRPLSYFPLSTWGWEETIHAVFRDRVSVVEEYPNVFVRSPTLAMPLPSVVALKDYHPGKKNVAFTRFNVFLRDGFSCQYCGGKFNAEDLTFDHVVPRCMGGRTSWTNVVAACRICNTLKADKTLMRPLRVPRKPTVYELLENGRRFPPRYLHESWRDYLYWDAPLEP